MSNALTKYNEIGKQREVLFFLKSILRRQQISLSDISLLCSHAPGNLKLRIDALLDYFTFIDIIEVDENKELISLNDKGFQIQIQNEDDTRINMLIEYTISRAFIDDILSMEFFAYDDYRGIFIFKPEKLSLDYASIRNTMIEFGFFEQLVEEYEGSSKTVIKVNPYFELFLIDKIKEHKRTLSLKQLNEQLIKNEEIGEQAEKFVLDYERRRLYPAINSSRVKQISLVDVSAGYDIISFNDAVSAVYDRHIEVKAVANNYSFFWSINEIETAKAKGNNYYLYLVDISKLSNSYEPYIINNPANNLIGSGEWLLEPQSYYVRKI